MFTEITGGGDENEKYVKCDFCEEKVIKKIERAKAHLNKCQAGIFRFVNEG